MACVIVFHTRSLQYVFLTIHIHTHKSMQWYIQLSPTSVNLVDDSLVSRSSVEMFQVLSNQWNVPNCECQLASANRAFNYFCLTHCGYNCPSVIRYFNKVPGYHNLLSPNSSFDLQTIPWLVLSTLHWCSTVCNQHPIAVTHMLATHICHTTMYSVTTEAH